MIRGGGHWAFQRLSTPSSTYFRGGSSFLVKVQVRRCFSQCLTLTFVPHPTWEPSTYSQQYLKVFTHHKLLFQTQRILSVFLPFKRHDVNPHGHIVFHCPLLLSIRPRHSRFRLRTRCVDYSFRTDSRSKRRIHLPGSRYPLTQQLHGSLRSNRIEGHHHRSQSTCR